MISPADVEYAYRLLLGRHPESEAVVEHHVRTTNSLDELRSKVLASREFKSQIARDFSRAAGLAVPAPAQSLEWSPMSVDISVPEGDLAAMIRRVETNWEELGRNDPHWSVLTHDKYRTGQIGQNEADFFASGQHAVKTFRASANRCGVTLEGYQNCFELGCGVGRVTRWLAQLFAHVVAADISAPHLALAQATLAKYGHGNVELLTLKELGDLDALPDFDVFFSILVLQHNPPPMIVHMLKSVLHKLRPSGIAYFQVPTYALGYKFDGGRYLSQPVNTDHVEMHLIPQHVLLGLIEDCGCRLLEIREDSAVGNPNWISNRLLLIKHDEAI